MGLYTIKPIKELDYSEFKDLLKDKEIVVSPHALDHMNIGERKVYIEQELTNTVDREKPRKIYLQENRRYAAYYRKSDGYRKIILDFETKKAIVVSFMNTPEIPRIKL